MKGSSKESLFVKVARYADAVETFIASVAFVFMCVFVLTTVVYRYVLKQPISWSEEASRYLMITGIFVAMPVAVRDHVHLGVEVFIKLLPKAGQRLARLFSDFVTLMAYVAIDYACFRFVLKTLAGNQTSPAMHIPMVYIYIVINLGFVLATVVQVSNMAMEHLPLKPSDEKEALK